MNLIRLIQHPHIPQGHVRLCAVGAGHPYIKEQLTQLGIEVWEVGQSTTLPGPVANHCDMLLHHGGGDTLFLAHREESLHRTLLSLGAQAVYLTHPPGKRYPDDISLNGFRLQDYFFCNRKGISDKLLNYYQLMGVEVIHTAQGYAKCACCIVDNNSIITADHSLAEAATACGLDVLRISPGGVLLPGYPYGFLGGVCGLLRPDLLVFAGDITRHKDHKDIKRFCAKKGVQIHLLSQYPLTDIGGIIPLVEDVV